MYHRDAPEPFAYKANRTVHALPLSANVKCTCPPLYASTATDESLSLSLSVFAYGERGVADGVAGVLPAAGERPPEGGDVPRREHQHPRQRHRGHHQGDRQL